MVLIRSPSSTYFDHTLIILVSGSRQPRSPGTCSIHTSKCCSHHHSPLLSLLASTHPCQTPGIGSIALSGPLEKKPLWPRHFTIHCILDCLISGQYHVQKCAEWLSVRKPQLRFFCQTNSDTGCKCSSNSVHYALANGSYRFMMSWIQSVLLKYPSKRM